MRASAVLGGEFDLPLVARCCAGLAFAAVCAAAAELQHEGLWVPVQRAAPAADAALAARFAFAHGALRQLVLVSTPEDARAELMRRAVYGERPEPFDVIDTYLQRFRALSASA